MKLNTVAGSYTIDFRYIIAAQERDVCVAFYHFLFCNAWVVWMYIYSVREPVVAGRRSTDWRQGTQIAAIPRHKCRKSGFTPPLAKNNPLYWNLFNLFSVDSSICQAFPATEFPSWLGMVRSSYCFYVYTVTCLDITDDYHHQYRYIAWLIYYNHMLFIFNVWNSIPRSQF